MILDELAAYAKQRVESDLSEIPLSEMKGKAFALPKDDFIFEKTLKKSGVRIISEVKKASPSKGIISEDFPYVEIAKEYEKVGADCISVLTEPKWFLGSDEIFREVRKVTSLPMIRKDFTIDPYQIYQAKVLGADAVLLICALLDTNTIREYLRICDSLGLSALVETHNEDEIRSAIDAGARIIGVNNRNLKDFSVDLNTASSLQIKIPDDTIFVAESGILSPEDGIKLAKDGADALLIGEALMRCKDKKAFIQKIKEYAYESES